MPFNEATVLSLQQLEGADNSFLKQICSQQGHSLRSKLNGILKDSPPSVALRWRELLQSLSNDHFFQGFAELLSFAELQRMGWQAVKWRRPGPTLHLKHPSGKEAQLLTLSFIQQRDQQQERLLERELIERINQIDTKHKISLSFRRPLNAYSNFDEILTSFASWLSGTARPRSSVSFRDAATWLEARLLPTVKFSNTKVVQSVQAPMCSSDILKYINREADQSLEEFRRSQSKYQPLILSIVSDQPLRISQNAWRFFLYGPSSSVYSKNGHRYYECDADQMKGWLQDPFRTFLSGLLRIENNGSSEKGRLMGSCDRNNGWETVDSTSFLNPWSEFDGFSALLPSPKLSIEGLDSVNPILCWEK